VPGLLAGLPFWGKAPPEHDPDRYGRVAQSGYRFSGIMLKRKTWSWMTIRRNVITRQYSRILSSAVWKSGSRLSGEIAHPPLHDQKKSHEPS
jgi:hypothetical protein